MAAKIHYNENGAIFMKNKVIRTLVISEKQDDIDDISKMLHDSSSAAFKVVSINAVEDHVKCSFSLARKKVIFKLMAAGATDGPADKIRPDKVDLIIYSMKSYFVKCYLNAMKVREIFRHAPVIAIVERGFGSLRLTSLEYVVDCHIIKPELNLNMLENCIFSVMYGKKNKGEEKTLNLKIPVEPKQEYITA